MRTNLIQNFIHTQNTSTSKKEVPDFDIHHELKNKNFIKPLKGEGRLIKGNILNAPVIMAKDIAYDVNALKHAAKGEANDHQLGKMNDLGLKIGGLAIAGYLFTKKQTPLTKGMEFVGLGSFLASMALWPKLAIQLPARLLYGFNVQQQYEDSMGRKKPFFQDPQFLPWDLYSDEKINKIGNYMGVPKNIPNRRDFIQEKMKKIAIQCNTLWMLTAGFATPVMSALICNQLEKPFLNILAKQRNNSNNNILNNFNSLVPKQKDIIKNVDKILSINNNQPLSETLLNELSTTMTDDFISIYVRNALKQDLKKLFESNNYVINNNSINTIVNGCKKALEGVIAPEIAEKIFPSQEQLTKYFDLEKGYFLNEQTPGQINSIFREYAKEIRNSLKEYNESNPDKKITKDEYDLIIKKLIAAPKKENPIWKGLTLEKYSVLNSNNQSTIKIITKALNNLNNKLVKIDKYVLNQMGMAPETTIANYWQNTIDTFIKTLKLTPKQIEAIKQDRLPVAEFIRNTYDDLASDKKSYTKVVNDFVSQIANIDKLINKLDVNDNILQPQGNTKFDKLVDKIFDDFVKEISKNFDLKAGEMQNVVEELSNLYGNYNFPYQKGGTYADLYKSMLKHRLLGVKSSLYRILNSLDVYRRIALGDKQYIQAINDLPREIKEEVVELSKTSGISAHSADFYTKFFKQRNPYPDIEDTSDIQLKNGRTVYKYFKKHRNVGKIDVPQDTRLFERAMILQYKDMLSPETEKILKPYKNILSEFKEYRNVVFEKIGNIHYIEKQLHKVGSNCDIDAKTIFGIIGAATDEIVHNHCKQAYNTRKWLTSFGKTGGILLGVTVLAQFFFGKMKTPKPIAQTTETQKG